METLDARVKTKRKPSYYNAKSFHGVRILLAICSIVVASILIFFCIELHNGNYKIPWTFLIVLGAAVFTLVVLILTLCIHFCMRLSPVFNLVLNIPLLILWIAALALLGWNIYGTLSHSCSIANWGNSDGVMICSQYKALFSFTLFAALSQIAMVVVDTRARVEQTRSGHYAKMNESTSDFKLESYDTTHGHTNNLVHDQPYTGAAGMEDNQHREEPGWRPGQSTHTIPNSRYGDNGDIAGPDGRQQVRMDHFNDQNDHFHHQNNQFYNQNDRFNHQGDHFSHQNDHFNNQNDHYDDQNNQYYAYAPAKQTGYDAGYSQAQHFGHRY